MSPRRSRTRRIVIWSALGLAIVVGLAVFAANTTVLRRAIEGIAGQASDSQFYELPNTIPAAEPGTIYRSEPILSAPDGALGWRVLYHSTDVRGSNILVSGVVVAPDARPPAEGRTVVSWGHPTTGAAARCAPSLGVDPFDDIEGLRALLDAGFVVAATDYSGMGAAGPASYLIGSTEGNNVLDAARAARAIPETGANTDLLLWGHSQGGHAALFAAQNAAAYAPEFTLRGVAVAAPATDLGELLNADISDVSGVTIGSYAFTAWADVYDATLESVLTSDAAATVPKMYDLCLLSQNSELHTIGEPLIGNFLAANPENVEPWATILAQNTPGTVYPVPLYVAQGDADPLVKPSVTASFVEAARAAGSTVTFERFEKTGHALVALEAAPTVVKWFVGLVR